MDINLYKVIQASVTFSNKILTDKMKENNDFSITTLLNVKENVFATDYSFDVVVNIAAGAILSYHDQLREKLLEEANIDIGDISV